MPPGGSRDETDTGLLAKLHPEDAAEFRQRLDDALNESTGFTHSHRIILPTDETLHVVHQIVPALDQKGTSIGLKGVILDRTSEIRATLRAEKLERFNSITGLPNRDSLLLFLERAVSSAKKSTRGVAVVCFELDRAAELQGVLENESYRALVQAVGMRLEDETRPEDTVSHSGETVRASLSHTREHQFAVVITSLADEWSALRVARRLRASLERPFFLDGAEDRTSSRASAGLSIFPRDGAEAPDLLRSAERALQHAKNRGGARVEAFSADLNAQIEAELRIEHELARALNDDSLQLAFQPRIELTTSRVVSFEALARWSRELESVPPSLFVPIAERSGLIVDLGTWALRNACLEAARWRSTNHLDVSVSVNVSPYQLREDRIVQDVEAALTAANLPPHVLELEITEGVFFEPDRGIRNTLHDLRALGVRLAVDDFGSGYASLPYLLRLPFNTIKLDQVFVGPLASEAAARRITAGVVALSHSLGMRAVAEGVESDAQLDLLRQYACDEVQGFLFSEAISPEEIDCFLDRRQALERIETSGPEVVLACARTADLA